MRDAPLVLLLSLALLGPARAQTRKFELTVEAGKYDRAHVPVCVPLLLPGSLAGARDVTLEDAHGKRLPGQLTGPGLLTEKAARKEPAPAGGNVKTAPRDLWFILPELKAGASATFRVTLAPGAPARGETFSWHDTKNQYAELRFGGRPVLRYEYHPLDDSTKERRMATFKVYHHLYDSEGRRVTKGLGGLYPHHRGLFYGFRVVRYGGDSKPVDIWHCTNDTYQEHEAFLSSEAGPVLGRHRVRVGWHGHHKELFAEEERELTVYRVPGGTLVEFASRLRTADGTVHLDGDPQHAGFHFRAAQEVAARTKKQTYYLRPDGRGKPGATRNWDPKTRKGPVNLPWDAMSFVLGGRRYTAAYLDRPSNPKEARYSERDYGRFGSYFVTDVTKDRPLLVDYRVWLQRGEMTVAQVSALDNDLVHPPAVRVGTK